ncbi:undecaprenyl-diphosphate phosphatase [Patescibacteria group bacterium]
MNIVTSALLGVVQGLTEFLPVSSSGHLVIAQSMIPGFTQPGVLFDVILHAGTLSAIVYYFRKEIIKLKAKYIYYLFIGTIPVVVIGFLFRPLAETFFTNLRLVGAALMVTGVINLMADRDWKRKGSLNEKKSLVVGITQIFAIIPGISRSGSTIFAGIGMGMDRKKAAQFSFLLSVPAIVGANIVQIYFYGFSGIENISFYLIGFLTAFITGIFAINIVLKLLTKRKFSYFAYYCFIVGIIVAFL